MARGLTITPSGGGALTVTPRPGSINIKNVPLNTGGDGIVQVRAGNAVEISAEVAVLTSSATYAALIALQNAVTKPADHAVSVETLYGVTQSITDASVKVSFTGEGIAICTITAKGNPA